MEELLAARRTDRDDRRRRRLDRARRSVSIGSSLGTGGSAPFDGPGDEGGTDAEMPRALDRPDHDRVEPRRDETELERTRVPPRAPVGVRPTSCALVPERLRRVVEEPQQIAPHLLLGAHLARSGRAPRDAPSIHDLERRRPRPAPRATRTSASRNAHGAWAARTLVHPLDGTGGTPRWPPDGSDRPHRGLADLVLGARRLAARR